MNDQHLSRTWRLRISAALLGYVGVGAVLLLSPDGGSINRLNVRVWYAVTSPFGLHTIISPELFAGFANVLLFVPAFLGLALLRPTWWWVAVACGLSTAVEIYQASLGGLRHADPWDVVTNTLGAAIGVLLGRLLHRRITGGDITGGASDGGPLDPPDPTTPDALPQASEDAPDATPDGRG